ncbi:50S ribosome-binding GTPase [Candidatus Pacearchaeota archaeon]|nr:50S ribosome-binding GTPase [Candidatus Pacearchaeota archaeon]
MASTNQSPFYKKAEEKFLNAKDDEERLFYLDEMIRECPKHKSSEAMLANLKTRRIKLIEKIERIKKTKKSSGKPGIRKADMQAVLIGFTNSGKSAILTKLTNAHPPISPYPFTTQREEIGTMSYQGIQVQIIDQPSLKNENFDIGLINNTDLVLIVVTKIEEIKEVEPYLLHSRAKKLIVFNKTDLLNEAEKRKIGASLQSKKYNFVMTSAMDKNEGIDELKEKILSSFNFLRIYLKEPGKPASQIPMIMPVGSVIKNVANKISKQLLASISEIHIWGPSSKFPNQKIGLLHELKDKDIVEFKTR